jgi:hypothetical protein
MFHDALQSGVFNNRFVDVDPFSPQFSLTTPPGTFTNPYVGQRNPFPAQFPPPKDAVFTRPVLAITYDPANGGKQFTPINYNWNLSFERQLAANWLARVAYVGARATHFQEALEMNPAVYRAGNTAGVDARRAFQPFGSVSQAAMDVNSTFHSAQFTLQKRISHGVTLLANYTWSKSLDTSPAGAGISGPAQGGNSPIPWNFPGRHQMDYGPSEFDHTHRLVVSYVWDLPTFAGHNAFMRYAVGGWQWSGIVTAQTGNTFTVQAGKDQSQTGLGTDRSSFTGGNAYGGNACGNSVPCVNYLNPAAFTVAPIGGFGNVGKGSLRGPGMFTWDTGLFKDFPIARESVHLQFRAEFFNVLNRTNFANPGGSTTNPNSPTVNFSGGGFGTITAAQDPRIGQLALKFIF